jgi:uncharacterized protein YcbK (DUF882 family)
MKITLLLKKLDGTIESRLVDKKEALSQNFYAYEFLVNKNDGLDLACVSQYDLDTLEYIRILYGLPITITSAGRTPEYNARKEIGGSSASEHQYLFDCLDFVIDATNKQLDNIYTYLIYRKYKGIGRYKNGRFHIDRFRDKFTVWDER